MKKPVAQFNCQIGDTVIVERRQGGRLVRRILTIVRTGIRRIELDPFEDAEDLRVVILPSELPAELAGFKDHPAVMDRELIAV
jgi:hypothetical protein